MALEAEVHVLAPSASASPILVVFYTFDDDRVYLEAIMTTETPPN